MAAIAHLQPGTASPLPATRGAAKRPISAIANGASNPSKLAFVFAASAKRQDRIFYCALALTTSPLFGDFLRVQALSITLDMQSHGSMTTLTVSLGAALHLLEKSRIGSDALLPDELLDSATVAKVVPCAGGK